MALAETHTSIARRSGNVNTPVFITVIVCTAAVFGAALVLAWFVGSRAPSKRKRTSRTGRRASGNFTLSGSLETAERGDGPHMVLSSRSQHASTSYSSSSTPQKSAEVPTTRSDGSSSAQNLAVSEKHGDSAMAAAVHSQVRGPFIPKRSSMSRKRSFDEDTMASMYSSMSAPLEQHDALLRSPIEWDCATPSSAPPSTMFMTAPPPVFLRAPLARKSFENSRTLMLATAHAGSSASSHTRGNPAAHGADNPRPKSQPPRVHWRLPIANGESELHGRDGVSSKATAPV